MTPAASRAVTTSVAKLVALEPSMVYHSTLSAERRDLARRAAAEVTAGDANSRADREERSLLRETGCGMERRRRRRDGFLLVQKLLQRALPSGVDFILPLFIHKTALRVLCAAVWSGMGTEPWVAAGTLALQQWRNGAASVAPPTSPAQAPFVLSAVEGLILI